MATAVTIPVTQIDICNFAIRNIGGTEISALTDSVAEAEILANKYDLTLRAVLRAHDWSFARKERKLTQHDVNPLYDINYQYQLPSDCIAVREVESGNSLKWKVKGRLLLSNDTVSRITYTAYHPATEYDFAAFTGSGLDDMEFDGPFTGSSTTNYKVQIDGVGTGTDGVDTFKWSDTGGSTWNASTVDIDGEWQDLNNGIAVRFNAKTGHTSGDYWTTQARASTSVYDDLFIQALALALAAELIYPKTNSRAAHEAKLREYEAKLNEARFMSSTESPPDPMWADEWLNARY
jgi:hypothetical protein